MVARTRPGEERRRRGLINPDRNARPHVILANQNRNIKVILQKKKGETRSVAVHSDSSHLDAHTRPLHARQHVLGQLYFPLAESIRKILRRIVRPRTFRESDEELCLQRSRYGESLLWELSQRFGRGRGLVPSVRLSECLDRSPEQPRAGCERGYWAVRLITGRWCIRRSR